MGQTAGMDRHKWLLWLIYARLGVFTIAIVGEIIRRGEASVDMLVLLAAVYALSACWFGLLKLNESYSWQSYAQIAVDLVLITWAVNRTGGVDSYLSSLYFLEIVVSSIMLEQRGAFVTGTACSVIHFAHMDLGYFGYIPFPNTTIDLPSLQYIISLNIFGFCSVAFLSNFLAESWRKTGAELQKSTGQVAFLQAFSDRVIDSLGTGLVTTDSEGRIFLFNRAAEYITGIDPDNALHLKIWDLFPGLLPKVHTARFEISFVRQNGVTMNLRFSVSPVMIDEKNTTGYVWCFDDVTELRLLERQMRQKEQMAALGAMSAGIAHEIRNPLASIAGSFNLLKSDLTLDDNQRQLAEIIKRETERLNRTITEFLKYARPLPPNRKRVDLEPLISETVQLMRNSPELKEQHKIETRLRPVAVEVDESMMRQVFYNLATNAVKAMPEGGTLTISLEGRNNGNAAQIRFEDTGAGLGEEELKRLFVPFNSSFKNGTGLGLPIVYQIVNAHNGAISVRSQKGVGTTFIIDL
jgi:two-component system, NtrC family, sensor histidine kinase PilS